MVLNTEPRTIINNNHQQHLFYNHHHFSASTNFTGYGRSLNSRPYHCLDEVGGSWAWGKDTTSKDFYTSKTLSRTSTADAAARKTSSTRIIASSSSSMLMDRDKYCANGGNVLVVKKSCQSVKSTASSGIAAMIHFSQQINSAVSTAFASYSSAVSATTKLSFRTTTDSCSNDTAATACSPNGGHQHGIYTNNNGLEINAETPSASTTNRPDDLSSHGGTENMAKTHYVKMRPSGEYEKALRRLYKTSSDESDHPVTEAIILLDNRRHVMIDGKDRNDPPDYRRRNVACFRDVDGVKLSHSDVEHLVYRYNYKIRVKRACKKRGGHRSGVNRSDNNREGPVSTFISSTAPALRPYSCDHSQHHIRRAIKTEDESCRSSSQSRSFLKKITSSAVVTTTPSTVSTSLKLITSVNTNRLSVYTEESQISKKLLKMAAAPRSTPFKIKMGLTIVSPPEDEEVSAEDGSTKFGDGQKAYKNDPIVFVDENQNKVPNTINVTAVRTNLFKPAKHCSALKHESSFSPPFYATASRCLPVTNRIVNRSPLTSNLFGGGWNGVETSSRNNSFLAKTKKDSLPYNTSSYGPLSNRFSGGVPQSRPNHENYSNRPNSLGFPISPSSRKNDISHDIWKPKKYPTVSGIKYSIGQLTSTAAKLPLVAEIYGKTNNLFPDITNNNNNSNFHLTKNPDIRCVQSSISVNGCQRISPSSSSAASSYGSGITTRSGSNVFPQNLNDLTRPPPKNNSVVTTKTTDQEIDEIFDQIDHVIQQSIFVTADEGGGKAMIPKSSSPLASPKTFFQFDSDELAVKIKPITSNPSVNTNNVGFHLPTPMPAAKISQPKITHRIIRMPETTQNFNEENGGNDQAGFSKRNPGDNAEIKGSEGTVATKSTRKTKFAEYRKSFDKIMGGSSKLKPSYSGCESNLDDEDGNCKDGKISSQTSPYYMTDSVDSCTAAEKIEVIKKFSTHLVKATLTINSDEIIASQKPSPSILTSPLAPVQFLEFSSPNIKYIKGSSVAKLPEDLKDLSSYHRVQLVANMSPSDSEPASPMMMMHQFNSPPISSCLNHDINDPIMVDRDDQKTDETSVGYNNCEDMFITTIPKPEDTVNAPGLLFPTTTFSEHPNFSQFCVIKKNTPPLLPHNQIFHHSGTSTVPSTSPKSNELSSIINDLCKRLNEANESINRHVNGYVYRNHCQRYLRSLQKYTC